MKRIVGIIRKKLEKELEKNIKDQDIATELGIKPHTLALLKTRDSIPYENIIKLYKKKKWDLNEVFSNNTSYASCDNICKIKLWDSIENRYCDRTDARDEYIRMDKNIIKHFKPHECLKNVKAIIYHNDDMQPTVKKGSILFIDCSIDKYVNPDIYLIRTSSILIRRLVKTHEDNITIISDNKLYPTEELPEDKFKLIGRVIGIMDFCR